MLPQQDIQFLSQKSSLITRRGRLKGKVTRFWNYLEEWRDAIDLLLVQARLNYMETVWTQFQDCQSTLEEIDPGNPTHGLERLSFEKMYSETITMANAHLQNNELLNKQQDDVSEPSHSSACKTESNEKSPNEQSKLQVPQFSGRVENWLSFRSAFISLVMETRYPRVQKLHCLLDSLTGEAAQIVDHLDVIGDNFERAWELLTKRYHDLKIIKQRHLKLLFEQSKMERENREDLRNLLDTTRKHVRALGILDVPVDHWDAVLVFLMTSKLDKVTSALWESETSKVLSPTYTQLCEFIEKRCLKLREMQGDLTQLNARINPTVTKVQTS